MSNIVECRHIYSSWEIYHWGWSRNEVSAAAAITLLLLEISCKLRLKRVLCVINIQMEFLEIIGEGSKVEDNRECSNPLGNSESPLVSQRECDEEHHHGVPDLREVNLRVEVLLGYEIRFKCSNLLNSRQIKHGEGAEQHEEENRTESVNRARSVSLINRSDSQPVEEEPCVSDVLRLVADLNSTCQ